MKNIKEITYSCTNNIVTVDQELMPKSLVLLNTKGKGFNIAIGTGRRDAISVIKALVKALLIGERLASQYDFIGEGEVFTEKELRSYMRKLTGCSIAAATDNNGKILYSSVIAKETGTFSTSIKLKLGKKNTPNIAKFVLEEGGQFGEAKVDAALNEYAKFLKGELRIMVEYDRQISIENEAEAVRIAQKLAETEKARRANMTPVAPVDVTVTPMLALPAPVAPVDVTVAEKPKRKRIKKSKNAA